MAIEETRVASWGSGRQLVEVFISYDTVSLDIVELKVVNPSDRQGSATLTNGTDTDIVTALKRESEPRAFKNSRRSLQNGSCSGGSELGTGRRCPIKSDRQDSRVMHGRSV